MQIKQDCHRVVLTICFVLVLVQFGSGFSLLLEYYKKRLLEVAAEIQIRGKSELVQLNGFQGPCSEHE